MFAGIYDRLANFRAELHHGLVHLRLDLLFEHDLAAFEDFLNVRTQLAGLRIDNGELLFDTESKRVFLAHGGAEICLKNQELSGGSASPKTMKD